MDFAFNEDQEELRRYVRQWLESKQPIEAVRKSMETVDGFDRSAWQEVAELGWQAMAIPEAYGGAGFGFLELAVLLEEQGRTLYAGPFLSTVILAANALLIAGSEEQRQEWLPRIAAGEAVATVAWTEPSGRWDEAGVEATAAPSDGRWVLNGVKRFVLDGHSADLVIVAARTDAGVSLFAVPAGAAGMTRVRLDTMDMTRTQAEIVLDEVEVPAEALVGADGGGWAVIARITDIAAVALALEQVGGAQACLDMSVAYAKDRVQFGRPIGSFQAIKHKCADMLVQVESARPAAYYAAWAVSEDSDEQRTVIPLAKAYCSEAYFHCAAENIQIHGGIGFTWEHDAHLYFKRAKSSELLFGDPAHHRAVLADRIGL